MPTAEATRPRPAGPGAGPGADPAATPPSRLARARVRITRSRLFGPGWPLAALFVGYPVWWLLGVGQIMCLLAAIPLGLELIRRRRIKVPRGFSLWIIFLAWILVGVFVLQVDAPGAIADTSMTRYLTFAFRLSWYVTATVALLYLGNIRDELPAKRLCRILAWMFVWIVLGGLAGATFPQVDFPSALEVVLPGSVSDIGFIHALIHPNLAQLQDILGTGGAVPRPSAPFTYTNDWGLNYACFLPFFVGAWLTREAGWRRFAAPVVLAVSLVPVVKSLDRGMWLAVVAMVVFVTVRSALRGRAKALGALVVGVALVAGVIVFSPLGTTLQERLAHPHSNVGRANLATLTVRSVTAVSPVVGLGSTRQVQGNFNSINGGATPDCPHCSPPSLGTQGQLWLVTFSQGVGGVALFIVFFALQFFRSVRSRGRYVTVGLCVVIAQFVTMPFYTSLGTEFIAIAAGVALLWRSLPPVQAGSSPRRQGDPTLGGYVGLARQYAALLVVCVLVGTVLGGLWQLTRGTPYRATISVLVPAEPDYPSSAGQSLDSDAQLFNDPAVAKAVGAVVGGTVPADDTGLIVTASPNTRILHIAYRDKDAGTAERTVTAAADAFLDVRRKHLTTRRDNQIHLLDERGKALRSAISTLGDAVDHLAPGNGDASNDPQSKPVQQKLKSMLTSAKYLDAETARVRTSSTAPGTVVQAATSVQVLDGWYVSVASGAMLGFLVGALAALLLHARSRRLRDPVRARTLTGIPVLSEVAGADVDRSGAGYGGAFDHASGRGRGRKDGQGTETTQMDARLAVLIHRPLACISVRPEEATTRALAARLDTLRGGRNLARDGRVGTRRRAVILLASPQTRAREVTHLEESLRLAGCTVAGLILVSPGRQAGRFRTRLPSPPAPDEPAPRPAPGSRHDAVTGSLR